MMLRASSATSWAKYPGPSYVRKSWLPSASTYSLLGNALASCAVGWLSVKMGLLSFVGDAGGGLAGPTARMLSGGRGARRGGRLGHVEASPQRGLGDARDGHPFALGAPSQLDRDIGGDGDVHDGTITV